MKCLGVEANLLIFECKYEKKKGWVENKCLDLTLGFAFYTSSVPEP